MSIFLFSTDSMGTDYLSGNEMEYELQRMHDKLLESFWRLVFVFSVYQSVHGKLFTHE